jgi:hypothetical protein
MKHRITRLLVSFCALVPWSATTLSAHAGEGVATYSVSTSPASFTSGVFASPPGAPALVVNYGNAPIPRFPLCGNAQLTGVEITVSTAAAAGFAAAAQVCTGITGVYADLRPSATASGPGVSATATPPILQTPPDLAFTLQNNCSVSVAMVPSSTSGTGHGVVSPASLAAWVGQGSVNVSLVARFDFTQITSPSTPMNALYQPINSASSILVTYRYRSPGYDVDGNLVVDSADLAAVLSAWGSASGAADVDGRGVVDAEDLTRVLSNWGAVSCN